MEIDGESGTADRPAGAGVAVADFDADGVPDVVTLGPEAPVIHWGRGGPGDGYVLDPGTLPITGGYESALPLDVDDDGDLDLVLGRGAPVMASPAEDELLLNDGHGGFTAVGEALGLRNPAFTCPAGTLAAADWDLDGDLDLVVTSYNWGIEWKSNPLCEGWNRVLLWQGDRYVDDALAAFPDFARLGPTFAVSPIDLDRDGRFDLLVNQDKEGVAAFDHAGASLGTVFPESGLGGMGIGVSDWNGDGVADVLAPWFGRAGLYLSATSGDSAPYYYEAGQAAGLGAWDEVSWAGGFRDIDNDGSEELLIANGAHNPGGDVGKPDLMPNFALQWDGGTGWTDRAIEWGLEASVTGAGNTHSWVGVELNGDGVIDYVQANVTGLPVVHLSQGCTTGHYVQIRLLSTPALSAGARVSVRTAEGSVYTRWALLGGTVYASGVDHTQVHIGLGPTGGDLSVQVTWVDGSVSEVGDVAPDSMVEVAY